ncbi:MAG: hypothetical protein PHU88_12455 [candidate division Zixibacteria bacterium]|nr:hypothetical protein [candidate division Zixibacteria bacterium]MDD5426535.1 hypothetical protein [candidate division Zixibacteria bacterium]
MNCKEYQEELMLYFGQSELPPELAEHISGCDLCRNFFEELRAMTVDMGEDKFFYPSEIEIEGLTVRINKQIDRVTPADTKVVKPVFTWYKLAGIAASIVLIVGMALLGDFFNKTSPTSTSVELTSSLSYTDGYTLLRDESEYYELSDDQFYILVGDYTSERIYDAAGQLLDDLSEEELKYLEENFKVGDLL